MRKEKHRQKAQNVNSLFLSPHRSRKQIRYTEDNQQLRLGSNTDQNSALLGSLTASSGNFLPTFRVNLSVPSSGLRDPKIKFLKREDRADWLSRNVDKKLTLLAA